MPPPPADAGGGLTGALDRLALWLSLRGARAPAPPALPAVPPGAGPLLWLAATDAAAPAADRVIAAVRAKVRPLRVLTVPAAVAADSGATARLRAEAPPAALLVLGDDLPAPLLAAAAAAGIPVILGDARIDAGAGPGAARAARRRLLAGIDALLLADPASVAAARRLGVPAARMRMTGPVARIRDPMPCNEGERAALATLLHRRQVWLAAAIPEAEDAAVAIAHRAALGQSHRALLIALPDRRARAPALAAALADAGFVTALRADEDEPAPTVQCFVIDDPAELGLWYRLAPLTFCGGTLSGVDAAARHPFEPAALGSAVLHGPRTDAHPAEWQQLAGAGAARQVADAAALAAAVTDLNQPDLLAQLAANAWAVSTGGAGVALQIAAPVIAALRGAAIDLGAPARHEAQK